MSAQPKSALLHALTPRTTSPGEEHQLAAWRRVEEFCFGKAELSARDRAWLGAAARALIAGGGKVSPNEAFGRKARRGHRYTVEHRRARFEEALFVAIPMLRGSTDWQMGLELQRMLSGDSAAPAAVQKEIDRLEAEGLRLPRSVGKLYSLIVDVLTRNPHLTSDRD